MSEPFILTTTTVGIVVLMWLWFVPLAALRRDNYRADIRRLRDELFDFMWQNGYAFDTPAYSEARRIFNGMLRWSNFIDAIKLFVGIYFASKSNDVGSHLEDELKACEPPLRENIERTLHRATSRTLHFIFLEGLTGIVVRLVRAFLKSVGQLTKIRRRIVNSTDSLIAEAYSLGGTDLSTEQRALLH